MTPFGRLLATAALAAVPGLASAECLVEGSGEVNVLMNFFPTTQVLDEAMNACEGDGITVTNKLSPDHKTELVQAFSAGSSPFDAAHVTNSSLTQLQAKGLVQPLNAFVDKYRETYAIEPGMEIRFGDDIVALAFMANAQVFYYRKDLFEKHGIAVPTTYDEILAAAEKLKGDPEIAFPFGAAFASGWELGNDFLDIFTGLGGELVDPMTQEPTFNGPEGVAALETMQKLAAYMSPNALAIDFGGVKQQLQQGQIAMAFLWGDLAASMDNPNESKVVGKIGFAPAPASKPGGPAATLFWWDGFAIPKNLDGDPELTFQVLMEALRPEVVAANNDTTLWLRSNYRPSDYAAPITASVDSGAPPYPMTTSAELAHAAIGEAIGNAIVGKATPQEALDAAAAAYRRSAKDAGLIQ